MTYGVLVRNLHLLVSKGLVKTSEIRENKKTRRLDIQLTEEAQLILRRISVAVQDFEGAYFAGFSEEEKIQYARLEKKVKENILRVLKAENGMEIL